MCFVASLNTLLHALPHTYRKSARFVPALSLSDLRAHILFLNGLSSPSHTPAPTHTHTHTHTHTRTQWQGGVTHSSEADSPPVAWLNYGALLIQLMVVVICGSYQPQRGEAEVRG